MSGGSWNYAHQPILRLAESNSLSSTRHRLALGHGLSLYAEAMKAIEWVDSGDSSPEEEVRAIEKVLQFDGVAYLAGIQSFDEKEIQPWTEGDIDQQLHELALQLIFAGGHKRMALAEGLWLYAQAVEVVKGRSAGSISAATEEGAITAALEFTGETLPASETVRTS